MATKKRNRFSIAGTDPTVNRLKKQIELLKEKKAKAWDKALGAADKKLAKENLPSGYRLPHGYMLVKKSRKKAAKRR